MSPSGRSVWERNWNQRSTGWLHSPASHRLDTRAGWQPLKARGSIYTATQSHFCVVFTRGDKPLRGRSNNSIALNQKGSVLIKQKRVKKHRLSDEIERSVSEALTTKIAAKAAAEVSANARAGALGHYAEMGGKLSSELQAEFVNSIDRSLRYRQWFEHEVTQEIEYEQSVPILPEHKRLYEHTVYWRWHIDIYQYAVSYMAVATRSPLFLGKTRLACQDFRRWILKRPLLRFVVYEPQELVEVILGSREQYDLADPDTVEVQSLTGDPPNVKDSSSGRLPDSALRAFDLEKHAEPWEPDAAPEQVLKTAYATPETGWIERGPD